MPDIVSVHYLQENKMKLKLNSNIRPNILSEIMILRENGGCGESLAQISNWHIYMGIAAKRVVDNNGNAGLLEPGEEHVAFIWLID